MLIIKITGGPLLDDAFVMGFTKQDMDRFAALFTNVLKDEYEENIRLTKKEVIWYTMSVLTHYMVPKDKRDGIENRIIEVCKEDPHDLFDYLFIATPIEGDVHILQLLYSFILRHREELNWQNIDSDRFFKMLSHEKNTDMLLEDIEDVKSIVPEDDEYYFEDDPNESNSNGNLLKNVEIYTYELPHLTTLLHIPVCQGQVLEDYNGDLYLASPQILHDYLDKKELISSTKIIIDDINELYQALEK